VLIDIGMKFYVYGICFLHNFESVEFFWCSFFVRLIQIMKLRIMQFPSAFFRHVCKIVLVTCSKHTYINKKQ
jgi:hypothetical protein